MLAFYTIGPGHRLRCGQFGIELSPSVVCINSKIYRHKKGFFFGWKAKNSSRWGSWGANRKPRIGDYLNGLPPPYISWIWWLKKPPSCSCQLSQYLFRVLNTKGLVLPFLLFLSRIESSSTLTLVKANSWTKSRYFPMKNAHSETDQRVQEVHRTEYNTVDMAVDPSQRQQQYKRLGNRLTK